MLGKSKFDSCDLIIQCGAPVFWNNCHMCEWNYPIWQSAIKRNSPRIPVLNLAIGSCYPLVQQDNPDTSGDESYITSILNYCRFTSARDQLTKKIADRFGHTIPVLPCSASLASPKEIDHDEQGVIVVNYMHCGGHYNYTNASAESWISTLKRILKHLPKSHRIAFLSHSRSELETAKILFPEYPHFFARDANEYIEFAQKCTFGIFNRLHAAVFYAGLGIPSISIGNDTRIGMISEFGLSAFDANLDTFETIMNQFFIAFSNRKNENKRLISLRHEIESKYITTIKSYC